MGNPDELSLLVSSAAGGDGCALERLLLREYEPLLAFIRATIPTSVVKRSAPEDLLQEALMRAAKGIKGFDPARPEGFRPWLREIAKNVMRDARKAQEAARRDQRRDVCAAPGVSDESILGLIDLLPASGPTPSRAFARREAVAVMRAALMKIPSDYAEAIGMRYLQGLCVTDIAARMNRTDRAVHMLCNRGLKALAKAMGSASSFLTSAP